MPEENTESLLDQEPSLDERLIPQPHRKHVGRIATLTGAALIASGVGAQKLDAKTPPKPHNSPTEIKKLKQQLTQEQQELTRVSNIASRLIGVPKGELAGKGLKQVSELPGYHHEISHGTRSILLGSTLELMTKPKGSDEPFLPFCTATKVSYYGHEGVLTAAHCLTGGANVDMSRVDGWPAQDIVDSSSNLYAVSVAGDSFPIAVADGIAYDMPGPGHDDFAFLSVQPDAKSDTPRTISQFDALPSADISKAKTSPLLGEQVGLFSDPEANNSMPVMGTGRYLGRATVSWQDRYGNSFSDLADIVGVDPNDPKGDSCNYGSSGSMAIGANGYLFGPLTWRQNAGYKDGDQNQANIDNPVLSEGFRLKNLEKELGIDLSGFSTLCGYQIIKHSADPQRDTLTSLIDGLEHFAPALPPDTGGFGGK